MLRLDKIEE